jgi:hypothetical protein
MTYSPTFGPAAQSAPPDPFAAHEAHALKVEFIMDSHCLSGELRYVGPPRRVVDMLNAIDTGYILVYEGTIADVSRPAETRRFEVAQVRRDAIMLAIPRLDAPPPPSSFEAVKKVPVAARFVIPGYEITGSMYMVEGADPLTTPVLANRQFTPVTDATITRAGDGVSFKEEIVIVNLACTLTYAAQVPGA